jgi:hypothetical protein
MTSGPTNDAPGSSEVDGWFRPRNFAFLLAFLIISTFPKVLMGGETFFYRDFGLLNYPWEAYHRDSFWRGTVPLWNPFNNCGVPFLAQWTTMVFYPLSIFYLIFPLSWSVGVFNLGHLFLAGLGMYFLAHHWTGNRPAACVAGLAYVCNGVMLHSLMWPDYIAGLGWMPWVVLVTEKAWREGGIRNCIVAALIGATEVLTGAAEPVIFTWGLVGLLWLVDVAKGEVDRRRMVGCFCAILVLVAGLTAAQMLPFLDLLRHSPRNASGFGEARWAIPGWGWANFIVPLFRCSPSILGVFSQDDQQLFSSYYLGIGTLSLALLAIWRSRHERTYLLAFLAVAGFLLAMGENTPVYVWLRKVFPLIKLIRFPSKFIVLTTFALPLLAAMGLSECLKNTIPSGVATRRSTIAVGAFLLVTLGCILLYAHSHQALGGSWAVTLESGASRAVFLVLILGTVNLLSHATSARAIELGVLGLLLLMSLDGLSHTANQNPTVARECYGPLGIEKLVGARLGSSRAMVHPRTQAMLSQAAIADSVKYYSGVRRALFMNCNLLDRIPVTTGFFSISPRSYAGLDSVLGDPRNEPPQPLLDFLGVSQISAPDLSFTWQARTNYMALATAGQLPVFASPEMTFEAVSSPKFEPRASVFLPLEARGSITVTNRSAPQITQLAFSDREVQLAVRAEVPAMVVVAQTFYHNWRASVDSQPAKLWEANYAFQAVEVPAGGHRIRLFYYDPMFKWGAVVSLSTLVGCFIAWVATIRPLVRRNSNAV